MLSTITLDWARSEDEWAQLLNSAEEPSVDEPAIYIDHKAIREKAAAISEIFLIAKSTGASIPDSLNAYSVDVENVGWPNDRVKNVALWYRRTLLRDARQKADMDAHRKAKIGLGGSKIVSKAVLASRRTQMADQKKFIENFELVSRNEAGTEVRIPCSEVYNTAEKRFAKLYVRCLGLERYCTALGLSGYFLTLTLPPEFHPNPSRGKNSWNGASPKDGHRLMQERWRSWQRRFGKAISMRVEEQHIDGCIHWHALVWIEAAREVELTEKLRAQFGPPPASVVLEIDTSKATGTSYLMKYLQKAAGDAKGMSSEDAKTVELADAHRATWGGRAVQIADIEGSASIWDEIRRVKFKSPTWNLFCLEGRALHSAATTNDYCEFLSNLSRINKDRKNKRCGIWYKTNEHGTKLVTGLFIDNLRINNREKKWNMVERKRG